MCTPRDLFAKDKYITNWHIALPDIVKLQKDIEDKHQIKFLIWHLQMRNSFKCIRSGGKMKNKLIIGRYLPTQSLIHELDPRAKLIFVFLFIITIFFAHSFTTFAWLLLIILAIMICAKIKLWFY